MRITTAHIENLTDWINREKGYPVTPSERIDGKFRANIHHIMAYRQNGHWSVVQIVNTGGGQRDLRHGTAREVYEFLKGMQEALMLNHYTSRAGAHNGWSN